MSTGDIYREAASALPRNALKGQFDAQGLDQQAVGRAGRLAEIRENMEAMGQIGGSIEGVIDRYGNKRSGEDAKSKQDQTRKKKGMSDALWVDILAQLHDQRDWLDAQANEHREYFADKYGEEWRTILGRSVLDDEEFPDRRPGETLDEYNARIEDAIFTKIANPDGTLKEEYKDHPDADRLAIWAKQRVQSQQIDHHIKNINSAETEEELKQATDEATSDATIDQLCTIAAGTKAEAGSVIEAKIKEVHDKQSDQQFDNASAADRSGDFFGPSAG